MSSTLKIAKELKLPADTVTSTGLILGGKGMGKTNLASVLVEELARARLRFAVLDPQDVWWGLRYAASGKGPGIEVLILGGRHGDLPLTPTSGAAVADLLVDGRVNGGNAMAEKNAHGRANAGKCPSSHPPSYHHA